MSTIRVDNFGPSAGGTTYSARGVGKAWVNFNGTGTIAARDSLNLSSLTDNSTGNYTVNFSSAFDAADYVGNVTTNMLDNGSTVTVGTFRYYNTNVTNPATTTGLGVGSFGTGGNPTPVDAAFMNVSVRGDLA